MFRTNIQKADAVVLEEDDSHNKNSATGKTTIHPMEQENGSNDDENVPFLKGELQPLEYRDVNYARAFYLQLLAVIGIAIWYGPAAFAADTSNSDNDNAPTATTTTTDNESTTFSMTSFFAILVGSLLASAVGTAGFFTLMMNRTESILKVSFFLAPALLFTFGLVLLVVEPESTSSSSSSSSSSSNYNNNYNSVSNNYSYDNGDNQSSPGSVVMIQAVIFAVVSGCVYFAYRRFIPFAISTLKVAGMAVRSNRGLYLLSAFMPFALSGWFLLWSIALVGVFSSSASSTDTTTTTTTTTTADDDGDGADAAGPNGLLVLILLFSFYWGYHVIRNVFHTTTAGTIGAWWFTPLADPALCSLEVTDSLQRSLTYSFGSICFGSLIVAIIQTLEQMAKSARGNNNRNGGALLACIIECILHLLRRWVEYFNSWAFCYVGLYGYDFLTAGKNVVSLFTNRGWSTFASDRLVFRVLYFANLGIAILSGGAACLMDVVAGPLFPSLAAEDEDTTTTTTSSLSNGDDDDIDAASFSVWVAFFIGFFVGAMVSSTALFVMESAVRTVIVCFAESPSEFYEFHPDLCQLMRDGWAQAYPEQWETAATPIVWAATATRHNKNNSSHQGESKGLVTATASVVPLSSDQQYDQHGPSLFAKEKDGLFRD